MSERLRETLSHAKILIFDFDGTLVDSNRIKIEAFGKCFQGYSGKYPEIMDYCQNHHHTPREVKFRHVFENILKVPYTSQVESQMLENYASWTTEQVIAAPEIPGAHSFLDGVLGRYETALLSSTPHAILLHILKKRNMEQYFPLVRGAPVYKADWIKQLKQKQSLKKEEVVFFGDSAEDAKSAQEADISFVEVKGGEVFRK